MTDMIEANYESTSAMQCKHCGNLFFPNSDDLEEHLEECEEFNK